MGLLMHYFFPRVFSAEKWKPDCYFAVRYAGVSHMLSFFGAWQRGNFRYRKTWKICKIKTFRKGWGREEPITKRNAVCHVWILCDAQPHYFSPVEVRKFSDNYVLAHCVCWNKRKRERLPVTHVHMTVYNFLQILTSLIASLTNPSLLMIIFAKII